MLAGEIEKRIFGRVRDEDNAAAVTPVAAVGAALGNELFPPKRDAPVPAVAGLHLDYCFIYEHNFKDTPFGSGRTEWAKASEKKSS
jgi:hypothetical protein